MNYLNLVNNVLKRLREAEVDSVEGTAGGSGATGSTDYGKLIGLFVNDAVRIVEEAWDWTALRETKAQNTSDATVEYTLSGVEQGAKFLDALNDTSNTRLTQASQQWLNDKTVLNTAPTGSPTHFTFSGVSSGDLKVKLYPTPDAVYALKFDVVNRSTTLSDDTSHTVAVPSLPIIQYAVALASRERGETGGMNSAELFAQADTTLADAIAMDAARHSSETIWYTV